MTVSGDQPPSPTQAPVDSGSITPSTQTTLSSAPASTDNTPASNSPNSPPVTDLTLSQWAEQLPPNVLTYDNGRLLIDLSVLMPEEISSMDDSGVVNVLVALHRAAFKAQQKLNQNLTAGSKLNAFQSAYTVQIGGIAVLASISATADIGDNLVNVKGRI